jgi:hypothetical protein
MSFDRLTMNEDLRLHREAEALMGLADQAKAQRRLVDAARLNREAAEVEARVVDLLPQARSKTRGAIAISSVALYRKAGALDDAVKQAEIFLEREDLPEFARVDLRQLLEEMRADLLSREVGKAM